MMKTAIKEDRRSPDLIKPIVAIGHTKDLVDLATIESFLAYSRQKEIPISTFGQIYSKLMSAFRSSVSVR